MASQSSIISNAVTSECSLSIWDPCPQSYQWGVNCAEATLISRCRKIQATKEPVENNNFFPQFVTTDAESENCTAWQEMLPISQINSSPAAKQAASDTIPQYSNVATKFRFCIVLAGPPGSGKSTMRSTLVERANIINKAAAQKPWTELGHDEIIEHDDAFIHTLNDITNSIKNLDNITVGDIKAGINNSGNGIYGNNWRQLLTAQQENYDRAKGDSTQTPAAKQQLRENILENIQQLSSIDSEILRGFFIGDIHKQKQQIQEWLQKEFLEKGKTVPFGNPETGLINNTELAYLRTALAIINGINITYETSLKDTRSLQFLFELSKIATQGCKNYNYIFLMGFPIVDFNSLENRIISRYIGWAKKSEAVRLDPSTRGETVGLSPLLSRERYIKNMQIAYLILASLIWFCTGPLTPSADGTDPGRSKCPPGIGIDFLLLFDNTGSRKDKEYAYVPISNRSYSIGIAKFITRRTNIQTNTKKALIALLMRSLNCLKGVSCHTKKISSACKDQSCADACAGNFPADISLEGKSGLDADSNCWKLPSQDSIVFGEHDGNMQNYEDDLSEFLFSAIASSVDNPSITRQTRTAVLNLKRNLVKNMSGDAHQITEMDSVFENQLAVFAFRMLLENLPKIRQSGVPIPIPEFASRVEQLEDYYGTQTIYNYLKCIADGDAVGDGNISKCAANLIPNAPENKDNPKPPTDCLERPNCERRVEGGGTKKRRKGSRNRRTRKRR